MLSGDNSLRFDSSLARNPHTTWLVAGAFSCSKIDNPGGYAMAEETTATNDGHNEAAEVAKQDSAQEEGELNPGTHHGVLSARA